MGTTTSTSVILLCYIFLAFKRLIIVELSTNVPISINRLLKLSITLIRYMASKVLGTLKGKWPKIILKISRPKEKNELKTHLSATRLSHCTVKKTYLVALIGKRWLLKEMKD